MYLRHPHTENYELSADTVTLTGTDITLDMCDSPTFIGLRQRDFDMELSCDVTNISGEGGITVYMCENEHYDILIRKNEDGDREAVLKMNIGSIKNTENIVKLPSDNAKLIIRSDSQIYRFYVDDGSNEIGLGYGFSKYLSSEVSGGFTGVMLGLYAVGGTSSFSGLKIEYK